MPTQVTNYQCPACTGPLHFSAETGKLTCEYCGSAYDVAEIEALYAQKEAEAAAAKEAADAKAEAAKADAASVRRRSRPRRTANGPPPPAATGARTPTVCGSTAARRAARS